MAEVRENRYQYDMDAVQAAAEEVATRLEETGETSTRMPIHIDEHGRLKFDSSTFENISPAARKLRIRELTEALMSKIREVIADANAGRKRKTSGESDG